MIRFVKFLEMFPNANGLQGQFFPFFVLTVVGIVTIPLTYSVLKPSSDPGATAPRIKSDFRPEHADLVDSQRKAQRKGEPAALACACR